MRKVRILGIDWESQGFPAEKTNATELGAVMEEVSIPEAVDGSPVDRACKRTRLGSLSLLMYSPEYPPQTSEITELTGITDAMLKAEGVHPTLAMDQLRTFMQGADYFMAHNVSFDKAVFMEQWRRAFPETPPPTLPWICSINDIPYPKKFKCKKLGHLALDHGVKMDDRKLHRATNDVELMFDLVLDNYHMLDIIDSFTEEKCLITADVCKPWHDPKPEGVKDADLVKAQGYEFQRSGLHKDRWIKKISTKNFQIEKNALPLRVSILG